MTQGKRSNGMITGGMTDMSAFRRIADPSLRGYSFPKVKAGQVYKFPNGSEIKILKPRDKQEITTWELISE